LFLLSELIQSADGEFSGAPALDTEQRGLHAAEALYRTRDGWIAVVAPDDRAAHALARALGLDELAAQPRAAWREAAAATLADGFRSLATAKALSLLRAAGVWVESCEEGREAEWFSDPFLQDQGIVRRFQDDQMGDTAEVGALFRMEHSQAGAVRPAPEPGEHSREILSELGYLEAEIDALFAEGVVS